MAAAEVVVVERGVMAVVAVVYVGAVHWAVAVAEMMAELKAAVAVASALDSRAGNSSDCN